MRLESSNRHNTSAWRVARQHAQLLGMAIACMLVLACSNSTSGASTITETVTQSTTSTDTGTTSTTDTPTTGATATPMPEVSPTATAKPAPVGTILYQANSAAAFAKWNPSGPWKIFQGELVNDGTGPGSSCGADIALLAPYTPGSPDVAIDAIVQFPQNYNTNGTGLVFRIATFQNMVTGYSVDMRYQTSVNDVNGCNGINSTDYQFSPGTSVHHIRSEIKGTEIKCYVDGALVIAASDAKYLGAGMVGIFTQEYMKVSSFTITQL